MLIFVPLGEKPYECPDCHEKFARNSTLKCHMAACQNGSGAKKGRKKVYECQVGLSKITLWVLFFVFFLELNIWS